MNKNTMSKRPIALLCAIVIAAAFVFFGKTLAGNAVPAAGTPTVAITAVTEAQKKVIMQLTSIFENSTPVLKYSYCENIKDGRGYTFGFAGFTSGTFDGTMLLKEYLKLRPVNNSLVKYLPAFEAIDRGPHDSEGRNPDTTGLKGFVHAVKEASKDPLFCQAQDALADRLYWAPSQAAADKLGVKLVISRGQLYDAFINHGDDGAAKIIDAATKTAGGAPGVNGVDEQVWLDAFLKARLAVLAADKTWAESVDRVKVYQKILSTGNTTLTLPISLTCYGDKFTLRCETPPVE